MELKALQLLNTPSTRMWRFNRKLVLLYTIFLGSCLLYMCSLYLNKPYLRRLNGQASAPQSLQVDYSQDFHYNDGKVVAAKAVQGHQSDLTPSADSRIGVSKNSALSVLPDSWVLEWHRVMGPDFETRPMTIHLPDGFKWWNFDGDMEPQCPSPHAKGLKCNFIEERTSEIDAAVNVRDFAHTSRLSPLPNKALQIYFALESPYAAYFTVGLNPRRDYLASFWRGSDLFTPYFRWQYYDQQIRTQVQDHNYAEGKTKAVAIVVSNCNSRNRRLEYVKELKKHIDVDIFGRCGTQECRQTDCFAQIKKEYKFYLSFENSNCRDYVTEKLQSNALSNDILPIVMGAHRSDYEAVAPQGSYLHVEDFTSPQHLAEFLHQLNRNDTMYNQYFQWKGTGEFVSQKALCEFCAYTHLVKSDRISLVNRTKLPYLNSVDRYANENFLYRSTNELLCLPPNRWYWDRE